MLVSNCREYMQRIHAYRCTSKHIMVGQAHAFTADHCDAQQGFAFENSTLHAASPAHRQQDVPKKLICGFGSGNARSTWLPTSTICCMFIAKATARSNDACDRTEAIESQKDRWLQTKECMQISVKRVSDIALAPSGHSFHGSSEHRYNQVEAPVAYKNSG